MFDYQQIPSTVYAEEYDKIKWNSSDKTLEERFKDRETPRDCPDDALMPENSTDT